MEMMLEQFKTIFDRPEKVKKLREMILDLAVRGKLVEQDPNDEPASVLLERIREEKERLIREKKIKKEKYNSDINQSSINYKIPDKWERIKLGDISTIITKQTGFDYTKYIKPNLIDNKEKGYIPMIQTKNFKGNKFNFNTDYYLPVEIANNFPKIILKEKALLLSIVGASIGNIGKYDFQKVSIIGGAICKVELINNKFMDYLYYFLQSPMGQNEIKKNYKSTAQGTITVQDVREIILSVPPLLEQNRIVKKLDSLMSFCDKLEEALEKKVHYGELCAKSIFNSIGNVSTSEELEEALKFILANFKDISLGDNAVKELKNCILQLAVQGKLVEQDPNDEPASVLLERIREEKEKLVKEKKIKREKVLPEISDEEKPFELPEGWEWIRLGNLISISSGKNLTKNKMDDSGSIPVYGGNGVTGYHNEYNVSKPTIVIGRVGFYCGSIHLTTEKAWVTDNAFITSYPNKYINQDFLVWLLKGTDLKKEENATAQPVISGRKIYPIVIAIPPLSEQKRIVQKVDTLMSLCDELENKIQEQKKYSNMLMESILKNSFSK